MPRHDRHDDRRDHRRDANDDDSDLDSDVSDNDYQLTTEESNFITTYGISEERANHIFNKQSGMCYISGFPLVFKKTAGLYTAEIVPRKISEPVSDENSIMVCRGVASMRESTGLTWMQFKSFINKFDE